jgi:hypothetical protein
MRTARTKGARRAPSGGATCGMRAWKWGSGIDLRVVRFGAVYGAILDKVLQVGLANGLAFGTRPSYRMPCRCARHRFEIAGWCNGSTTDSGSVCLGSNPSPATSNSTLNLRPRVAVLPFIFNGMVRVSLFWLVPNRAVACGSLLSRSESPKGSKKVARPALKKVSISSSRRVCSIGPLLACYLFASCSPALRPLCVRCAPILTHAAGHPPLPLHRVDSHGKPSAVPHIRP